ncbi:sigma-70 family RNA polymerase sigma factor [Singulisphaera sp. GP187]|uniref:sigma-70 family RNA polymerase sigma factor n=1 Tax=Singulisphaera sp. GP187 TaxID=1882752 RepID=UPI0009408E88|nr:sigma-70 family RNA polymerase sigma factor [Singulisphaera sp. GP187]
MLNQLSDASLLERFVTSREEDAFATLVQRHGPRVLGACRRILRNEHDAEEVSQATFLVLARKAADIPWRESVGSWLCAVAHRLSLNARAGVSRRTRHEVPVAALASAGSDLGYSSLPEECHPQADPFAEIARRELRRVLDEELSCLPEKYRAPMVLCYLEGLTNEEAAEQLGWPSGSMSRRLERARTILRQRLASRGLWLGLLLLLTLTVSLKALRVASRDQGQALVMVREAMAPFKSHQDGGEDLERLLAAISRSDESLPSLDEALVVARRSTRVAERIENFDHGADRAKWNGYAVGMRQSALAMTEAAERGDSSDVVAAARQLNQRCIQCHVAFRH